MQRNFSYSALVDGTIIDNLKLLGVSESICKLLRKSKDYVTHNSKGCRVIDPIRRGEVFTIHINESPTREIPLYNAPLTFSYEDDDLAVIDKEPGLAVISSRNNYGISLENALASIWGQFVYHPINRLDKNTTGLILVAKHCYSASILTFSPIYKEYRALVYGKCPEKGIINAPISRKENSFMERCISKNGKEAITEYERIWTNGKYSLLKIILHTGRTHQIRVHFASVGHPLCGDTMYGAKECKINDLKFTTQCLNSHILKFKHPFTNETISLTSSFGNFIEKYGL